MSEQKHLLVPYTPTGSGSASPAQPEDAVELMEIMINEVDTEMAVFGKPVAIEGNDSAPMVSLDGGETWIPVDNIMVKTRELGDSNCFLRFSFTDAAMTTFALDTDGNILGAEGLGHERALYEIGGIDLSSDNDAGMAP